MDIDNTQTQVGFVGLGLMGKPMARNLISAGFKVTVLSRSRAPIDELKLLGAHEASSIAHLCDTSEVIITMLPTPSVTTSVVLGEFGILSQMKKNSLFIDMGTQPPQLAKEIFAKASEHDILALDAPVSGGDIGAENATLSIMVGGTNKAFEIGKPILETLGTSIYHVGDAGSGQTVKAANQIMVAGILATISEALVLLENSNLNMEAALSLETPNRHLN